MTTRRKPLELFFTMAHFPNGPRRVGPVYRTRESARGWLDFVRGATRCRASVRKCVIRFDKDGKPTAASLKRLDEEFNIEITERQRELLT